ncbi:uncharacterized protein LOC141494794 isoform X2 [Macrotis lagotis]|uniref:uncharacterized protein LOC141494794 isoform X2 n=1 Tax=Macrotis lagotis TaxID=92651 RepID=UPI003D69DA29
MRVGKGIAKKVPKQSESSQTSKIVNSSQRQPKSKKLKTEKRMTPPVALKNWSIYCRRPRCTVPQWLIMPICTIFNTFAFLVLVICTFATNRWAVLVAVNHSWEQDINIWKDCFKKTCWRDITFWPAIQTAQGFMISTVICSFLLTTWLLGFFCTSSSLKQHYHFICIFLSTLTGTSLFIVIMLIVFVLEKAKAARNTFYIVLWPFYMLWIAFILLLASCILGIISYKKHSGKL